MEMATYVREEGCGTSNAARMRRSGKFAYRATGQRTWWREAMRKPDSSYPTKCIVTISVFRLENTTWRSELENTLEIDDSTDDSIDFPTTQNIACSVRPVVLFRPRGEYGI
jgi:D-alanyl-D-alanine carboxypeptidase